MSSDHLRWVAKAGWRPVLGRSTAVCGKPGQLAAGSGSLTGAVWCPIAFVLLRRYTEVMAPRGNL